MSTSCQSKKKTRTNYVLIFFLNKYKLSTKAMKMYNWLRFNGREAHYYS
jgi:hypothetical protein